MTLSQRRIGPFVDILSGFPFDSDCFGDSGSMPVVRIRDVVRGNSSTYYSGTVDERYVVRDGDILIGMDGEFNRARWRGGQALLNQRVCRIQSSSRELDDGYLFHMLPRGLKQIEQATSFVTVKHLSVKQIRQIEILMPPIAEQRRIAEILDKADALRAKRRAALTQLDTLTQSIFLEMFGDPSAAPNTWPVQPLIHFLAAPLRNGLSPSKGGRITAKVLTLSAITGKAFNPEAVKTSTFQSTPPLEQSVHEQDLLLCRGNGNLNLVGKGHFPLHRMPDVTFPTRSLRRGSIGNSRTQRFSSMCGTRRWSGGRSNRQRARRTVPSK